MRPTGSTGNAVWVSCRAALVSSSSALPPLLIRSVLLMPCSDTGEIYEAFTTAVAVRVRDVRCSASSDVGGGGGFIKRLMPEFAAATFPFA